jgi:DNA-binding response OmpR family regulator
MQPLILLADGDDDLRQTCAEYLQAHGFRVEEAADPMQAMKKVRTLAPSVLIIDASLALASLLDGADPASRVVILLSTVLHLHRRRRSEAGGA